MRQLLAWRKQQVPLSLTAYSTAGGHEAKEGELTENQALQPPVQCPCSPPMTARSPSLAKGTDLTHVSGGGGTGVTPAPGCIPHPGPKNSIAHLSSFLPSLQRAETTCYSGKERGKCAAQRRTGRLKGYSLSWNPGLAALRAYMGACGSPRPGNQCEPPLERPSCSHIFESLSMSVKSL